MVNTSSADLAREILQSCLQRESWNPESLHELLQQAASADPGVARVASRALFTTIVERLGDLFEPRLCDVYARLFSEVIAFVRPELAAADLCARYRRIRQPRNLLETPKNIFVLSRITLGADVAVTSVILDAMKKRFPESAIWFVGPRKNWELFAADPRIHLIELNYGRSETLANRLQVHSLPNEPGIVIDPDSRITQLGLLPICDESKYFFFESRGYGGDSEDSLTVLTTRWIAKTFGVENARAYIDPLPPPGTPQVTVSFGVGENPEKRIAGNFETDVLTALAKLYGSVLVDTGAGGEEAERVVKSAAQAGVETWQGSYAPFASMISRSKLYLGYDSAGQHVAAACGVPLISVFAGYISERMFQRWRPTGTGPITIVKVDDPDPALVLSATLKNL